MFLNCKVYDAARFAFGWYYPTLDPVMGKTKQKLGSKKRRMGSLFHLDGKG